jgi:multidrug efflux pump subunit AcrB
MSAPQGLAGRVAATFVHSKLTPLVIVASLLLGVYAVVALPREEEPQIIVPMIDVFAALPGATPTEVEQRLTRPLEQMVWDIPGVEYVYSTSSPEHMMLVVRFVVGEDEERALVRLNQKLAANASQLPAGVAPQVKARSIDDVPVMALTLWGRGYDEVQLRQFAATVAEALKELPRISEVAILGGRQRQITVELDPASLAAHQLDPLALRQALAGGNARAGGYELVTANRATAVEAGQWPASATAIRDVVAAMRDGAPVRVGDVATVPDAR